MVMMMMMIFKNTHPRLLQEQWGNMTYLL